MDDPDVRQQPLGHRLRYGVTFGLFAGVLYAVIAATLVGYGAGRSIKDFPITTVVGLYLGGGILTGLVFGFLAPFCLRRTGAVVVGILAMLPTGLLIGLAIREPTDSLDQLLIPAVLFAAAIGGAGGFQLWEPVDPPLRSRNPFANL